MVLIGLPRFGLTCSGLVWINLLGFGLVRLDLVLLVMVWYGLLRIFKTEPGFSVQKRKFEAEANLIIPEFTISV